MTPGNIFLANATCTNHCQSLLNFEEFIFMLKGSTAVTMYLCKTEIHLKNRPSKKSFWGICYVHI